MDGFTQLEAFYDIRQSRFRRKTIIEEEGSMQKRDRSRYRRDLFTNA